MKCPLKFMRDKQVAVEAWKCEEEKCAWWIQRVVYKEEQVQANDGVWCRRQSDIIDEVLSEGCALNIIAQERKFR